MLTLTLGGKPPRTGSSGTTPFAKAICDATRLATAEQREQVVGFQGVFSDSDTAVGVPRVNFVFLTFV